MSQRTFTFSKKPKCLDNNPEVMATRIRVGTGENSFVFTMKNFSEIPGHDDSLPYTADLYCNKEFICKCHNDGWGGETEITTTSECTQKLDKIMNDIKEYSWKFEKSVFPLSISFVADILAKTYSKQ